MIISFGYQWPPARQRRLGLLRRLPKSPVADPSVCDAGLWPSREVAPEDPHVIVVGGNSVKAACILSYCLLLLGLL